MDTAPKRPFLITYDLIGDNKGYKRIEDELRSWNCTRVLLSAWRLPVSDRTTGQTADTLLEHFRKFIDEDDKLIVVGMASYAVFNPR